MNSRTTKLLAFSLFLLLQLTHYGGEIAGKVNLNKLHPSLRSLITTSYRISTAENMANSKIPVYVDQAGERKYGVIIKADDLSRLDKLGIHFNSSYEKFATAKVTLNELMILSAQSAVTYIDLPAVTHKTTNVSTPATGASILHNGFLHNTAYKGQGSIVLVFDTGIDWKHKDFRDPLDTTRSRILFIWDQTIAPVGAETNPSGFNYGVEYTNAQINNELDGSPANFVRQLDFDGHGTHVASTAAGNNSKFKGIAPEADLIIVKGGEGTFAEDNIIDALTYAEAKKNLLGEPIVINYSLGGHSGPHDGSNAYELAIDNFNSKAGLVAVVAAGNDGGNPIHVSGSIALGGNQVIQISVPVAYTPNTGAGNDDFIFNAWYDGLTTVTATVTSPTGITYSRTTNTDGSASNDNDGHIYLANVQIEGTKTLVQLHVNDEDAGNPPASGTWNLTLSSAGAALNYDGWLVTSDLGGELASLSGGDTQKTVAEPGTAVKALTVGAYVTRLSWPAIDGYQYNFGNDDDLVDGIANFSSIGPTRDNRLKPDITAPGKGIFAAFSQNSSNIDPFIHPSSEYLLSSGTSMATPHVTGAVALLLAVQPGLTADQIRTIFQQTAVIDSYTGSVPNNIWGNGKMDILNAMVTLVIPDTTARRDILKYDAAGSSAVYGLTGTVRLAVCYTPVHSGRLSGIYFQLRSADPEYNPIVSGSGSLVCTVHSDNGGFPGVQIGSTVNHSLSLLDPGTNNYINLLPANVSVTAGINYYIVLALSDGSNSIYVLFDDGDHGMPINLSYVYSSGSWRTTTTAFGSPYNLRLHSEINGLVYATPVLEADAIPIVQTFKLNQNYPNPFNPATHIEYILPTAQHVIIKIYDMLGREINELVNTNKPAGKHTLEFKADNLASGVYIYMITAGPYQDAKKFVLIR